MWTNCFQKTMVGGRSWVGVGLNKMCINLRPPSTKLHCPTRLWCHDAYDYMEAIIMQQNSSSSSSLSKTFKSPQERYVGAAVLEGYCYRVQVCSMSSISAALLVYHQVTPTDCQYRLRELIYYLSSHCTVDAAATAAATTHAAYSNLLVLQSPPIEHCCTYVRKTLHMVQ